MRCNGQAFKAGKGGRFLANAFGVADEFKRRNLAQSPPSTERNSRRNEQSILPIIHVDHLHLRGGPLVGRADSRTRQADSRPRQAERVYLCAKPRATFVRRREMDERG